jgi:hypothetical protein
MSTTQMNPTNTTLCKVEAPKNIKISILTSQKKKKSFLGVMFMLELKLQPKLKLNFFSIGHE